LTYGSSLRLWNLENVEKSKAPLLFQDNYSIIQEAIQIYNEALKLLYKTGIIPVCVYGGESFNNQIADLREGCDILIGTPGRLIDIMNRGIISLCIFDI